MKNPIVLLFIISILLLGCKKKEKIEFTLNSLTLSTYIKEGLPNQSLYIKVIQKGDSPIVLATTDFYPSEYTLPAEFGVSPSLQMNIYKHEYSIELWGDSTGIVGETIIDLDEYKIIYPLEMESEENEFSVTLKGTWK